jgi:hypothetical protein
MLDRKLELGDIEKEFQLPKKLKLDLSPPKKQKRNNNNGRNYYKKQIKVVKRFLR